MVTRLKVKFIINSILTVLSLCAFVFFVIFAVEFLISANAEEGLSKGLGMAISLIIMIICDIVTSVIVIFSGFVNLATARAYDGKWKGLTVAMGVFNVCAFGISVVTTAVFILLNNIGAFS